MLSCGSKSVQFRVVVLWILFYFVLVTMGCGSRTTNSGSGSTSEKKTAGRIELDVPRCAGFGPAEAAAILGVAAEKFHDRSQNLSEDSRWCILENPGDSGKSVMFTVSRAKSVDDAATEFSQFRQNAGVAVRTLGKEGQKAHEIPGLGDEALWTPVPGGVYLRRGRYTVQVNQPAEEATQVKIARKILGE